MKLKIFLFSLASLCLSRTVYSQMAPAQHTEPNRDPNQPTQMIKNPQISAEDFQRHHAAFVKAHAQSQEQILQATHILKSAIEAKDLREQYGRLGDLIRQRQAETALLIQQLNSKVPQQAFAAAYLIGEYQIQEALPQLVELLIKENPDLRSPDMDTMSIWGNYPMAEAVIKFGRRATPNLIQNIAASDLPKVRQMSLDIITAAEGVKMVRFLLTSAVEQENNPLKKSHLQAALANLPG